MVEKPTDRVPLSQRLHAELARVIEGTDTGGRLPTEPKLARQLGVSRATLREAMRTFETQGLIRRRQGVGTFVVRPKHILDSGLEVLESIETLARRTGMHVTPGELKIDQRQADEAERAILELDEEAAVTEVSRVILAEKHPVAYLVDVLPTDLFSMKDVEAGFSGSVLDLLLHRGDVQPVNSFCEIAAVAAASEVARAMNIQRGDALLLFKSRLFSVEGRVIDYSLSYFLPGSFRFHVVRHLA
jgi:GntR family transcriptional regulator